MNSNNFDWKQSLLPSPPPQRVLEMKIEDAAHVVQIMCAQPYKHVLGRAEYHDPAAITLQVKKRNLYVSLMRTADTALERAVVYAWFSNGLIYKAQRSDDDPAYAVGEARGLAYHWLQKYEGWPKDNVWPKEVIQEFMLATSQVPGPEAMILKALWEGKEIPASVLMAYLDLGNELRGITDLIVEMMDATSLQCNCGGKCEGTCTYSQAQAMLQRLRGDGKGMVIPTIP